MRRLLNSRMLKRTVLTVASLSAVANFAGAQDSAPPVSLPFTHEHSIRSHVNGREYKLMVALPPGYKAGASSDTTHYPVFYLLDGGISLPLVASMYWHGNVASVSPVILVGINWARKNGAGGIPPERTEDFTPTVVPQDDSLKTGGAAAFARVIREEIIPFVEHTYRASGERGILGNSYGGLFEAYTLFAEPDLFQKYVIGSPSLWWDHGVMFARESQFARTHKELDKRIYLAVGGEENDEMQDVASRFADSLRAHHYKGLKLTTERLTGERHSGVVTAFHGLTALYPFLVSCDLRRKPGEVALQGQCVRGGKPVAQLTLNPPIKSTPSIWRGAAKFSWRPQEEPFALDWGHGATLRTGTGWFDAVDVEADSSSVRFGFDWDRSTRPSQVDLAIIRRARLLLADAAHWDRSAMPDSIENLPMRSEWTAVRKATCPRPGKRTFFCALYDASVAEAGEYWHGRPALDAIRSAVSSATGGRLRHPVFDINSDSATTLATLQRILDDAQARTRRRITAESNPHLGR